MWITPHSVMEIEARIAEVEQGMSVKDNDGHPPTNAEIEHLDKLKIRRNDLHIQWAKGIIS